MYGCVDSSKKMLVLYAKTDPSTLTERKKETGSLSDFYAGIEYRRLVDLCNVCVCLLLLLLLLIHSVRENLWTRPLYGFHLHRHQLACF